MAHGRMDQQTELEAEFEFELEDEFEFEAEDELEGEYEDEFESELEGEFEDEAEDEYEDEFEAEFEAEDEDESESEFEAEDEAEEEAFFGGLAKLAGSFLGDGEGEDELEDEAEFFWKKFKKVLGGALPVLRKVGKFAIPALATALTGPVGGMVARAVTSQLEGETEDELESELEDLAQAPIGHREGMAEYLAARAATAATESEAESFAGSAVTMALSRRDRADLERMLPQLLRGTAVLTRMLYRDHGSRAALRLMPSIVGPAARTLARQFGDQTVDPAQIGAVLGGSAQRVLSDPRWQQAAMRRHAYGLAHARRHRRRTGRYSRSGRSFGGGTRRYSSGRWSSGGQHRSPNRPNRPGRPVTVTRHPGQVRTVGPHSRVPRPPRGFVRVVTPVKVPGRGGAPARTVRVVSDVRVPRGAVPAGRPVQLATRRR